jgi:ring-1,2-phenylacetyl-CoA epoxidase subunit PaaE
MAIKFHTLKIRDVVNETHDSISIVFDVPDDLRETFHYKPGQYLTVQVIVDDQKLRRAYSLSSSPLTDEHLKITIKRVHAGRVSNFLNDWAKAGLELEVMPPLGNFAVDINANNHQHYILFGGGSGVTPIMSILKSVLAGEPQSRVTLFYANRNFESIIFYNELNALKEKYTGRFTLIESLDEYADDWHGEKGMIDKIKAGALIRKFCGDSYQSAVYYICGPAGMMQEAESALAMLGIDKTQIHREHFTSNLSLEDLEPTVAGADEEVAEEPLQFPVKAKVILDGTASEIEINEEDTVLEAAMDAGLDPPFACQIGACTTCRAKLKHGKVKMKDREALTDEEIEEGYILTCQSHPVTNALEVDYDG